ncbi:MAG: chalcone isomerase family protein [Kangiellaceae bacterium]|nr:chalcone isomerase family protein [Kangiellaceae bacterium]
MKKALISLLSLISITAITLVSQSAVAAEQVNVAGSNLQLNGISVHSELRKEWFLAGLYLPSKVTDADAAQNASGAKRMQLKVLADSLSGVRLKRFWIERIKNNNNGQDVLKIAKGVRNFATLMAQNLQASDVIDIDLVPAKGTVVSINGSEVGVVDGAVFPLVLNTWLGDRPPTQEFKDAMLGSQPAVQYSDLLAKFSSINPSAARVAVFDSAAQEAAAEEERKKKEEEEKRLEEERKAEEAKKLAEQQAADAAAQEQLRLEQQRQDDLRRQQEANERAQQQAAEQQQPPAQVVQQPVVEQVPAGPTEAELNSMRSQYTNAIRSKYVQSFAYPLKEIIRKYAKGGALRPRQGRTHGDVSVSLEVDRDGELVGGAVTSGSGEKILDDAVSQALFDAAPYPAMPKDLPEDTFKANFTVSIPAPQM